MKGFLAKEQHSFAVFFDLESSLTNLDGGSFRISKKALLALQKT
jgi:hypothetical protein